MSCFLGDREEGQSVPLVCLFSFSFFLFFFLNAYIDVFLFTYFWLSLKA